MTPNKITYYALSTNPETGKLVATRVTSAIPLHQPRYYKIELTKYERLDFAIHIARIDDMFPD